MSTLREVGARAGVSAKTVSRVLNRDGYVSEETRERVESALRELDYVPNALATTFRSGRLPVIGVAVPDVLDPFFARVVRSVEDAALAADLGTLVTSLGDDPQRERRSLELLLRQRLAGLVISPVSDEHAWLRPWAERTPTAFVDRPPHALTADAFLQDDRAGGRRATEHLIGHGHRRIGFLGDREGRITTAERRAGWAEALTAAGLEAPEELVAMVGDEPATIRAAFAQLRVAGASAVFSSNARITIALVPAIAAEPLPLVGFGDFPLADLVTPAVTVVRQDPAALGRLAAERVLERLEHPGRRLRRTTVLDVDLVERASCR